ncbi:MAG: hypothetical protein ACFFB5_20780 [Promethearchaeota archaeon]
MGYWKTNPVDAAWDALEIFFKERQFRFKPDVWVEDSEYLYDTKDKVDIIIKQTIITIIQECHALIKYLHKNKDCLPLLPEVINAEDIAVTRFHPTVPCKYNITYPSEKHDSENDRQYVLLLGDTNECGFLLKQAIPDTPFVIWYSWEVDEQGVSFCNAFISPSEEEEVAKAWNALELFFQERQFRFQPDVWVKDSEELFDSNHNWHTIWKQAIESIIQACRAMLQYLHENRDHLPPLPEVINPVDIVVTRFNPILPCKHSITYPPQTRESEDDPQYVLLRGDTNECGFLLKKAIFDTPFGIWYRWEVVQGEPRYYGIDVSFPSSSSSND